FGHVVSVQHRATQKEETITEAVSGLIQGTPRLGTDHAIGVEAAAPLELDHRLAGSVAELATVVVATHETERGQPVLDVADGFPGVAQPIQAHPGMVRDSRPRRVWVRTRPVSDLTEIDGSGVRSRTRRVPARAPPWDGHRRCASSPHRPGR